MNDFSKLLAISVREGIPQGRPWLFELHADACLFSTSRGDDWYSSIPDLNITCALADIIDAEKAGLLKFISLDNSGAPLVLMTPGDGLAVFWDDPAKARLSARFFS